MYILYCMNGYGIFILIFLIMKFFIELMADLLNITALQFELPKELHDLYDPNEYRKSQEYLRVSTQFGLIESAFSLLVIFTLWFSGGFNILDHIIRSWSLSPIINGLLYLGLLFLAYSLVMLPFSVYDTFVIEERFGFNRTKPKTFVLDRVKALILSIFLGGTLFTCVLALFQYTGGFAWIYCWIVVIIFLIAIQFISPNLILPIFNKFTPMETGELREAILAYAKSVNFPIKNIYIMDGSKRSAKSNAFFTGFGSNKRIALFDTLIEKHSNKEIVAILAHEVGHYKKKHAIEGMAISIIYSGLTLFLFSVFLNQTGLYQAFYMDQQSIYTGIIFFSLLFTPLAMAISIVMNMISRSNEATADNFAAETVDETNSMMEALKKLSITNLANLTPHPLYVFLNYSHPPLLQRIKTIERQKSHGK